MLAALGFWKKKKTNPQPFRCMANSSQPRTTADWNLYICHVSDTYAREVFDGRYQLPDQPWKKTGCFAIRLQRHLHLFPLTLQPQQDSFRFSLGVIKVLDEKYYLL